MTENISRSGVLFRAPDVVEESTPLDMHFALPLQVSGDAAPVVVCRGVVVRAVHPESPDVLPAVAATISRYRFVRRKGPAGA
jgi:hypothetical protein